MSGWKNISWEVRWTSGLKGLLQVNSLADKKAKNTRVKAALKHNKV